ncbi:tRNA-specific adenosine deaminase [Buchnera aphidicola (Neophyllaphis podocarpi)]|uniref:tRNA adenosine(34) deaminase TadA n=1 Tax=Buchnera aphidicola TaxID=9 RepID=UPI003463CF09
MDNKVIDKFWMKEALKLAKIAYLSNEVPVGSVLVNSNNIMIGQGYNTSINKNDPTAHAEILAIRDGSFNLQNYRLLNTTLYVTLEPCIMCIGAIINSRIKRLVFSLKHFKNNKFSNNVSTNLHRLINKNNILVETGILKKDSLYLLSSFFKTKRKN